MKLFFLIFIPVIYSIKDSIQTVTRNSYFLPKISYNSLLHKIEDRQVNKIYFSAKYDTVISENINGDKIEDYSIFGSDFK